MTNIYSLVSIDRESKDEYVQAISFDRQVLENFLVTVQPQYENLCDFAIKDYLPIYKLQFVKELGKRLLLPVEYSNNLKLHGFNKITSKYKNNQIVEECNNVLLDLSNTNYDEIKDHKMFKDNVSLNEILFDTYYNEGIMNA